KTVTGQTAGSITITASATGLASGTTTFTVTPGAASKLVITSATADLQSGTTRALTAEVRDASDNVVSSDSTTSVTFAKTSGTGTVTGLGAATAANGVASKTVTGQTAGSITITASATGLASGTTTFTVTPGAASKLVITSATADLQSGTTRALTAEVRDASDNVVSSDSTTSVTFAKTSGTGTVTGLGAATAANGVASKTVTGQTAGSITITASATGLASGTTTFTVTPGDPSAVEYVNPDTSNLQSGSTRTFTARIRDAAGNTVTGYVGNIGFSYQAGPGTVTGLPSTVVVASGTATSGTITAVLLGNVTVRASSAALTTADVSFLVVPVPTSTSLTLGASSVQYSDQLTLTATISPADLGNGQIVSGSVSFYANANLLGSASLVVTSGVASASISPA